MRPEKHGEQQEGRSAHLSDVVEAAEEFVEDGHELLRCAGAGKVREAHDISVQDTAEPKYDFNKLHSLAVRGWASGLCVISALMFFFQLLTHKIFTCHIISES